VRVSFTTSWPITTKSAAANYMAQALRAEEDLSLFQRGLQFWLTLGSPYKSTRMPTITPIQRGSTVTPDAIEQFIRHVECTKGQERLADDEPYGNATKPSTPRASAGTVDLRECAGPNPTIAIRIEHGPVLWETGWYEGRVGYTSRKEHRWDKGLTGEDVRVSRRRQGVVYNFACPSCSAPADPCQTLRNGGHQGACMNRHLYQVCRLHLRAEAGHSITEFDADTCSCWMPRRYA